MQKETKCVHSGGLPDAKTGGINTPIYTSTSAEYLDRDRVPYQRRGLMIALTEFGWSLSFIIGVPLVGFLIARRGWQAPFPWLAGAGLLSIVMLALLVPNDRPAAGHAPSLWRNLGSFDTNPMGIDWFGMVFGFGLAVSFGYWCTDFLQVQRVIVAKDLRSAQNGTLIGAALKMCVPIIVTLPGLLGLAVLLAPDGSPLVLVAESDARARLTHYTYNDVLPLLMGQYLGPGLLGLGVTAMIAGFMSGMAGNVTAFATVWTYDVYKPLLRKNASDSHYLAMGRWCSNRVVTRRWPMWIPPISTPGPSPCPLWLTATAPKMCSVSATKAREPGRSGSAERP